MKLVSWNCRGAGNPSKVKAIGDMLKMENPYLLMIQETKLEEKQILTYGDKKWKKEEGIVVSARGASGGLATLWSENTFDVLNSFAKQHWIFTELTHKKFGLNFSLFNIYTPNQYKEKRECWGTIVDFLDVYTPPHIILAGELNIILKANEKKEVSLEMIYSGAK